GDAAVLVPTLARRRWWWSVGAAVALAAGVVLAFGLRAPALPHYGLEHGPGATGIRKQADGSDGPLVYESGIQVTWTMRPDTAVEGDAVPGLVVFAYPDADPERGRMLELPPGSLGDGALEGVFQVSTPFEALGLAPGAWTLVFVVGAKEALPSDPGAAWVIRDGRGIQVEQLEFVHEDAEELR
ncbi:MAG: hypothetical protein KC431_19750, partial [Myxococcales bacterium]|nr:hypothetical protein [Myxococcales bacterium]